MTKKDNYLEAYNHAMQIKAAEREVSLPYHIAFYHTVQAFLAEQNIFWPDWTDRTPAFRSTWQETADYCPSDVSTIKVTFVQFYTATYPWWKKLWDKSYRDVDGLPHYAIGFINELYNTTLFDRSEDLTNWSWYRKAKCRKSSTAPS